jgi:hypothetical protein
VSAGTAAFLLAFVLRLRLGWGFVQRRLKERVTYYEANQRGFLSRKEPEAALRDRLIERSQVAPSLRRIDKSLLPLLASIVVSTQALDASDVPVLRTLSGESATRYTNQLRGDDEFAAAEQAKARQRGGGDASEQESASRKTKTAAEWSRGVDLGLSSRTPDTRPSSKCMLLATPYALCPASRHRMRCALLATPGVCP